MRGRCREFACGRWRGEKVGWSAAAAAAFICAACINPKDLKCNLLVFRFLIQNFFKEDDGPNSQARAGDGCLAHGIERSTNH